MPLTMYDDVNLDLIPADAEAVAGYVNGRYRTWPELVKRWPVAKHLSIAVSTEADAECLDIERYDALPSQAPAWFRRQKVRRPALYCSLADVRTVVGVMKASGIPRRKYRLVTAHYTYVPHLCSKKCGLGMPTKADATQYTDKALGRSLDATLVSDSFFDPGIPAAVRRKALRTWLLARKAKGWSWARLKATAQWKTWKGLGGK